MGEDNLEILYIVTDCFIFSFKPIKGLIEDLKHFKEDFDFSDLDPFNELYSVLRRQKSRWKNEIGNSSSNIFR